MTGIGPQTDAVATADGGLAVAGMLGQLLVVDMADGTVRWRRAITDSTDVATAAGLVLSGSGARLTAYDDRTGVLRWTVASTDMDLAQMQMAAGLLVVSSAFGGSPVTAYAPATGRVAWTFETPGPEADTTASWAATAAGRAVVAVAAANLPAPGRLYLLDLATGRVRWRNTAPTGVSRNPVANFTALANADPTAVAVPQRNLTDSSAPRSINDGECEPVTVQPSAFLTRQPERHFLVAARAGAAVRPSNARMPPRSAFPGIAFRVFERHGGEQVRHVLRAPRP